MTITRVLSLLRGKQGIFVTQGPIRGYASSAEGLRRTGLYDFHLEHGANVIPFAGYSMPLSYGDVGQVASHNHVRKSVMLGIWLPCPRSCCSLPTATTTSLPSNTLSSRLNESNNPSRIRDAPAFLHPPIVEHPTSTSHR
ncbi:hypothetical protein M413DRAFT_250881 [Hebeloma cylindrosporum]|uniref:Uncharacterized protein n=1 Tax=Hebeloma cylindrosporum TaxID=76867 RepID=A0A0C2YAT4_HEBCY|nr:hypothetical protein M413DRAFT_250881 [Hebeloma cylindrosporum h7]